MYIPKIENGKVKLYNEKGVYQRTVSLRASEAVFADINAEQTLIAVTLKNGKVELYNEKGLYHRSVSLRASEATSARWAGADIAVALKNGKVELYNVSGLYLKTI